MINTHQDKILILDFGSQYTQLIARRIREIGVFSELVPFDIDFEYIKDSPPKGIILSGGPDNVINVDSARVEPKIFGLNIPILGICYGMQTMSVQLGGDAKSAMKHEYGFASVNVEKSDSKLFGHIVKKDNSNSLDVWMSHGIEVSRMPDGFELIASSKNCAIAAIENSEKNFFGLQFHPEVTHTIKGKEILERFIDICNCQKEWTVKNIVKNAISNLRNTLGDKKVVLGLSGGVDSSVSAAIIHKAIGSRLTCIFIDNGLLRLNEKIQVEKSFKDFKGIKIIYIDASDFFLKRLNGIIDPEEKRKIIGKTFIDVFQDEAKKINNTQWLAQGTIYPDVIESAASSENAHLIKSHHNVAGLPENMNLKLVEPLRELFKDEVRKLGIELGIDKQLINRHPFPGPGLAVRILGEVKKEYADILREADNIFIEMLHEKNLYNNISQAFTVFMPVKSVGVTGDGRAYGNVVSLRAVKTIDFMTAKPFDFPFDFLEEVSTKIINEIPSISRVCLDISSKPPATIEWE